MTLTEIGATITGASAAFIALGYLLRHLGNGIRAADALARLVRREVDHGGEVPCEPATQAKATAARAHQRIDDVWAWINQHEHQHHEGAPL